MLFFASLNAEAAMEWPITNAEEVHANQEHSLFRPFLHLEAIPAPKEHIATIQLVLNGNLALYLQIFLQLTTWGQQ